MKSQAPSPAHSINRVQRQTPISSVVKAIVSSRLNLGHKRPYLRGGAGVGTGKQEKRLSNDWERAKFWFKQSDRKLVKKKVINIEEPPSYK